MQVRQRPCHSNLEYGARAIHSTIGGRPVEIAVTALNQPCVWTRAIVTEKLIQVRQHSVRAHLEDGARIARPSLGGRPIKITIAGLDQSRAWIRAIRAVEPIQRGQQLTRRSAKMVRQKQEENLPDDEVSFHGPASATVQASKTKGLEGVEHF